MSPFSAQVSYAPDMIAGDASEAGRFNLHVRAATENPFAYPPPTPGARLTSNDFLNTMLASVLACPRSPSLW